MLFYDHFYYSHVIVLYCIVLFFLTTVCLPQTFLFYSNHSTTEPAYIKRIREEFQDEKPVRPKQQIFSEHQLKANRYEIDINYTPLAMTEMARQSRLEDQYVAAQMKYVNSLEANKVC